MGNSQESKNAVKENEAVWGMFIAGLTLKTLICAIGYTLVIFCWGGPDEVISEPGDWILRTFFGGEDTRWKYFFNDLVLGAFGFLIACGPTIWRIVTRGISAGLFDPSNYVVITTYSDGSKSSDGGAESMQFDVLKLVLGLTVGVILGAIVTVVSVIALWIGLVVMCFVGKDKAPAVVVMPIFLIFAAWLVCAPFVSIQMQPYFNPHKYDVSIMTEAVEGAQKFLSENSYSTTLTVRQNNYKRKHRNRHNYEAKITHNKAKGTTVVEITPLHEGTYMEYFNKGKNNALPGTYTFKNSVIESMPSNKPMTEDGINEVKSLLPAEVIAQMEKLILKQSMHEDLKQSVRENLWGRVKVREYTSQTRKEAEARGARFTGIEKQSSRDIHLYYWPWLHGWMNMDCYTIGGKLRMHEYSGTTETGRYCFNKKDGEMSYK